MVHTPFLICVRNKEGEEAKLLLLLGTRHSALRLLLDGPCFFRGRLFVGGFGLVGRAFGRLLRRLIPVISFPNVHEWNQSFALERQLSFFLDFGRFPFPFVCFPFGRLVFFSPPLSVVRLLSLVGTCAKVWANPQSRRVSRFRRWSSVVRRAMISLFFSRALDNSLAYVRTFASYVVAMVAFSMVAMPSTVPRYDICAARPPKVFQADARSPARMNLSE